MKFEQLLKHSETLINFLNKENRVRIYPNYDVVIDAIVNEFDKRNILIIANGESEAEKISRVLKYALLNPEFGCYPYEIDFVEKSKVEAKMQFLSKFYNHKSRVVLISTLKGMFDPILPEQFVSSLKLTINMPMKEQTLIKHLSRFGFKRVVESEERGEFSVKGNIIDLYSFSYSDPIRIVFGFEGTIEEIKFFDINTFKSFKTTDEVEIFPASYYNLLDEKTMRNFEKAVQNELKGIDNEYLSDSVQKDLEEIRKIDNFGINFYFKYILKGKNFVFPTLFDETDDFIKVSAGDLKFADFLKETKEIYENNLKTMETLSADIGAIEKTFKTIEQGKLIELTSLPRENTIELPITNEPRNFPFFTSSIKDYILATTKQRAVLIATEEVERVRDLLKMYEIFPNEGLPKKETGLYLINQHYERGVETDTMVLLTDREIFLQKEPQILKRHEQPVSVKKITSVEELADGDLVVHRDFGIGIFRGLIKLNTDGTKEYLNVEYRDGEKLYVPLERIGFVEKYIGDKHFVPLTKLGGNEWRLSKEKAKESTKELAKKLLLIQAQRKLNGGFAFKAYPNEERILALSFPYELTDDQETALSEVYNDMESSEPMDRLICGDVGYGKTEIAVRAAFRAVLNGKQVAVLVPTTILAMQHERTFRERLRLFPVEIASLSRLEDTKSIKQTLEKLKDGTLDIVVGTHRLLSKDVSFKDLGLLIVDEEQKFGVRDKEKIKALRANIDLLTLTATPIPRTLHSALITLKSTSLIMTAPSGRIPVKTFVLPFSKEILQKAIKDELTRGGQAFVVHNKIEDIFSFAQMIKSLVPEAKIAVAHGKMIPSEIEKIMIDFYEGNINVLVSTTIIENGLDIPTVNTLIVDNAQNFGLSEMYQLRGRIGRSSVNAFAYFFYEEQLLRSIAEERLETIKEFSGMGAGIKIAMKDLEIRGAGNILGAEQHGHIVSVGYNMYVSLLAEAVSELKGEKHPEFVDVPVRLNESFYIEEAYIKANIERINYYKRITSAKNPEELQNIRDEMVDRFGEPSKNIDNLLTVGAIMAISKSIGVKEIFQEGRRVFLSISKNNAVSIEGVQKILQINPSARIGEDYISFEVKGSPLKETLTVLNLLNGEKYARVDN
ncbi:MAG: transcription-repair coupling factor [Caldisericaceae bacterium]